MLFEQKKDKIIKWTACGK